LEIQKREQKELQQTSAELMGKRSEWDARLAALTDLDDYKTSKKLLTTKSQLKNVKREGSSDQDEEYSESERAPTPPRYRQLDADQARCIDFFMVEVDKLSEVVASKENRDPRRDEDLITLMALKQFVRNYFLGDPLTDQVCRIMKSKIKVNEMIMVLSSLKFKDKNPDMLLVTMKQFTDIFFELVVNPESFKTSQINFYRGGKSIINVFIFLVKGYFQQVRIMRSIYSDELAKNDVLHLFEDKEVLDVLRVLVSASLQLAALPNSSGISGISHNSAFQVHSSKNSQSHRQPQPQPPADPSQEVTTSSQEKLQFQGSLLRSAQGKPLPTHQYSFEFGRDMTGSDRHSNKEENLFQFKNEDSLVHNSTGSIPNFGGIQIPIAGNINSFVTNLLKKTSDNRLKPN
jgi:hypothetical protein